MDLDELRLVEQERFLRTVDSVSLLDTEFAFRFCQLAIPVLIEMEDTDWEPWVDGLLETFKTKGLDASADRIEAFSDERPDDIGGYRGQYGIVDTVMALIEIRHIDIHPYCITIDTVAHEYLNHIYGETNYIIINQTDILPQRMTDIYRRLTH